MIHHKIADWDDAYANAANIPQGDRWPAAWVEPARAFREALGTEGRARTGLAYGDDPRNRFDLFLPQDQPKGLVVFVHGGFWMRLERSFWSHLAAGPLAHGQAVAMPSYTLCPDIRISGIVRETGAAIDKAASMIEGPIRLAGHSAGGHLVTRMICAHSPLSEATRARVVNTVSISGVHDLRPLMRTQMNQTLKIDTAEANARRAADLLGWRGRAFGIRAPERLAGQCVDRARRDDAGGRGTRPPPFQRDRRAGRRRSCAHANVVDRVTAATKTGKEVAPPSRLATSTGAFS